MHLQSTPVRLQSRSTKSRCAVHCSQFNRLPRGHFNDRPRKAANVCTTGPRHAIGTSWPVGEESGLRLIRRACGDDTPRLGRNEMARQFEASSHGPHPVVDARHHRYPSHRRRWRRVQGTVIGTAVVGPLRQAGAHKDLSTGSGFPRIWRHAFRGRINDCLVSKSVVGSAHRGQRLLGCAGDMERIRLDTSGLSPRLVADISGEDVAIPRSHRSPARHGAGGCILESGFGSLGRPRTRSPTMLRWISAVPPQMVSDLEKKKEAWRSLTG
jgi:hypothetical protein